MAVLISGIGRSGTTTMFNILGDAFLAKYKAARCVYEPYLWDIPEVERTGRVKGQPFNVGQVGLFNTYVHCNTPLFLSGRNELHDGWLRRVYGPVSRLASEARSDVLAKVIRGSGRLEAALSRFENLKIIVVTRNVVDTVNSGLGLFSFFGDEFHPSDKSRFVKEVNEIFDAGIDPSAIDNEMEWAVLWWRYFTEASISTYEKYPQRVMLIPYEKYITDKLGVMEGIFEFAGVDVSYLDQKLLEEGAGPTTKVSYITRNQIDQMDDQLAWYFGRLRDVGILRQNSLEYRRNLVKKFDARAFRRSLLLEEKTDLTAVQWRMKLSAEKESRRDGDTKDNKESPIRTGLTVSQVVADFGDDIAPLTQLRYDKASSVEIRCKAKRTIGVVVTCFNNENTIREAVYSILSQSKRPDRIVVADDCSSDGSVEIVNEIAAKHKEVVLARRSENVGIAANRDLAIRDLDTDYITTLDGDDLFLPGKLEIEYAALGGRLEGVAFSDIAVVTGKQNFIQDTSGYHMRPSKESMENLLSRSVPVPRDMMFPKKLFEKSMGFDLEIDLYEDWAFKMRLISVAGDGNWKHSGGIGTVYDRREPGLSNRSPIFHAYGQLLVIARNFEYIEYSDDLLLAGLSTVATHLDGQLLESLKSVIDGMRSGRVCLGTVHTHLQTVWEAGPMFSDEGRVEQVIQNFCSIL